MKYEGGSTEPTAEGLPKEEQAPKAGEAKVFNLEKYKARDKENDQARIRELQNELTRTSKTQEPLSHEEVESLKGGLDIFEKMAKLYDIKRETIILDSGESTDKEHSYTFPNLESPTKDQDLYLGMLGSMATSLDIDLSIGLTVEQVVSLIESRIAVQEDLEMAA